ncbi:MAG: ABC transporter ATP-binding protein [Gammaproteobacteria bacterium]|jgi:iron complex transport system ATP-binding protein
MSLKTDGLEVRYGATLAVKPTSIELRSGELIGLIGPNGAGKTSLLRALAGIPEPSPQVGWDGKALSDIGDAARARAIAYLPQSPQANWPLSVRDLVALGRLPHGRFGQRLQPEDRAAIDRALEQTETASLADRAIDRLSGGERMRAHLARAFAVDAPVLLVDEPVASLDPYHQLSVMQLLDHYRRQDRLVIAVLHDLNLALQNCSRLLLMDGGAIVVDDEPRSAIDAATLAEHYRIRAWLAEHQGRRVAVPWEILRTDG